MMSAVSCYEKVIREKELEMSWPFPLSNVQMFINWAILEKELSPNTVRPYIHHLATIHKQKNFDEKNCKNFANEAMIRGAENLSFYDGRKLEQKNVMTLPLLRVLGHEVCVSDWSEHSKSVIWCACTCAFFGSFRLGELLSKEENRFNPFETLLWRDVTFLKDDSVKIHSKIPKTRTQGGETINGTFLTNKKLKFFLSKRIGAKAGSYTCQSFRGGLPSALASKPKLENDGTIKKWGRWNSDAFERYTRLNHIAKRVIFERFVSALDS